MNHRRFAIVFSGGLVGGAALLFACSSGEVIVVGDQPDGGQPDSGDVQDKGDGGNDGAPSVPDADAPDVETYPDAGLTEENYDAKLAQTLCKALARCCFGDATLGADAAVDGGTYDQQACVDFYTVFGFGGSAGEIPSDRSNLVIDNAKGDECIAKLETLECNTPGVMYTAVAKACFGALVGKGAAGDACTKSIECAPGHFCDSTDGGTGTCTALRGADGNCGDWFSTDDPEGNAERSGEACSYRGKGVDTGRYCDFYDFTTFEFRPQAEWKCKTAGGVGADCADTPWCKDSMCDDIDLTYQCVTPKLFFAPTPPGSEGGCGKFVTPE